MDYPNVNLFPFSTGGLIDCLYVINVKLCFDSMATTDETISVPIELYLDNNQNKDNEINNNNINDNNQIKNIPNPYKDIFKDDDDLNDNLNINHIEENNNKINNNINKDRQKNCDGFEVIEHEDFINAMNTSAKKLNESSNK